jgi:hypothetical protein
LLDSSNATPCLRPRSLLKPPGSVKAAANVTVAISVATIKRVFPIRL